MLHAGTLPSWWRQTLWLMLHAGSLPNWWRQMLWLSCLNLPLRWTQIKQEEEAARQVRRRILPLMPAVMLCSSYFGV